MEDLHDDGDFDVDFDDSDSIDLGIHSDSDVGWHFALVVFLFEHYQNGIIVLCGLAFFMIGT